VDAQLPDWLVTALREDRKSLFRMDALRALFYTAVAAGLLWAITKKKLQVQTATIVLAVVCAVDIFLLSRRFLDKDKFQDDPSAQYFAATVADKWLMENRKPGERVLNLIGTVSQQGINPQAPFNEARTSYYHESIGGYHGAKMRRYQDVIDRFLMDDLVTVVQTIQTGSRDFSDAQLLNMLNARYFLAGNDARSVVTNQAAFGHAWTVDSVAYADTPEAVLSAMEQVDLRTVAVVHTQEFKPAMPVGVGTISQTSRTPNKLVYDATISGGNALVVFSEVYYKQGWKGFVDGKEVPVNRANYILRAMEVPEGKHTVELVFKPESYGRTSGLMAVSSGLILLVFVGGLVAIFKERLSGN
jgi:hypothetical protein